MAQARTHLTSCWDCRARAGEIESTIADFVRASRQGLDPQLPPITGSRVLLKAQLTELTQQSRPMWWRYLPLAKSARGLACVFALALITLGVLFLQQRFESLGPFGGRITGHVDPLPQPNLTPGFTRRVTLVQICSEYHDEVTQNVPRRLQQEVFKEYGMQGASPADYEVDYLITPGLGGADDIRNLWPEPHYDTQWNSFVKDRLEDQLHQMVCSGKLNLATAQQDLSRNWIAAYKKYFHTEQPLPIYQDTRTSSLTSTVIFHEISKVWTTSNEVLRQLCRDCKAESAMRLAACALPSKMPRRQSPKRVG